MNDLANRHNDEINDLNKKINDLAKQHNDEINEFKNIINKQNETIKGLAKPSFLFDCVIIGNNQE